VFEAVTTTAPKYNFHDLYDHAVTLGRWQRQPRETTPHVRSL
jgi:hypothetical protein